jgi:hypothetical protein
MLCIFHAVNYYADLLIKPTSAQLHLYTLQYISAATIRPSSGRMFFLDKAAYGTLVLINIYIYNHCHMLKVYVKIVVDMHKKCLKSTKLFPNILSSVCGKNPHCIHVVYITSANSGWHL